MIFAYRIRSDFAKLADVSFSFCLGVLMERLLIFQPFEMFVFADSEIMG
jgi:hypothetical protein